MCVSVVGWLFVIALCIFCSCLAVYDSLVYVFVVWLFVIALSVFFVVVWLFVIGLCVFVVVCFFEFWVCWDFQFPVWDLER